MTKCIYICPVCGREFSNKRKHQYTFHRKGPHKWTVEERKEISEKRKKFLRENPDKHPWKSKEKFKSKPCEYLKQRLRENGYQFFEEQGILGCDKNYSLDIFFPQIKVAIEVNGNQHYDRFGDLLPYYQERHNEIESFGIKLLELPYNYCYKEDFFERLCRQLDAKLTSNQSLCRFESCQPYYSKARKEREAWEVKRSILISQGKVDALGRADNRILSVDDWENRKDLILNSGIDLRKFGWVGKVTEKTGLTKKQIEAVVAKFNLDVFRRKS